MSPKSLYIGYHAHLLINATGTPADPIIFTFESDPAPKTAPTVPPFNEPHSLLTWGGVIIW